MKVAVLLAVFLPVLPAPGDAGRRSEVVSAGLLAGQTFEVKVSGEDPSQLSSVHEPSVIAVRQALTATILGISDPSLVLKVVPDKLATSFPGAVSVVEEPLKYTLVFCPEIGEWVIKCCDIQDAEVRLASVVHVQVVVITDIPAQR